MRMLLDELERRYAAGERDFRNVHIWGELIEANLPGIDLRGATLDRVRLNDANLEGANLHQASVTGIMNRANLVQADLSEATLISIWLKSANLTGANLRGANLRADVRGVNVRPSDLSDANLTNADLSGADLTQADLRGADLRGANLTGANLTQANLSHTNLTDALLTDATLDRAILGWTIMPDGSIHSTAPMNLLASKLDTLKRNAWLPITVAGDGERNASKFAGYPWLNADESYPLCSMCHTPLRFFLQLNLDQLPSELGHKFGNGMLQLFYCTNEDRMCDTDCGWEPFSPCKLVRIVQPSETPADVDVPKQNTESSAAVVKGEFLPRLIVDWKELDAYPDWEEAERLHGVQLSQDELNAIWESEAFDAVLADYHQSKEGFYQQLTRYDSTRSWALSNLMRLLRMHPPEADRLAGYPRWVQDVEYPNCPVCDRLMDQLIFEFASDEHVPYLWGDVGTGYFLQCPDHLDQVTFTWQCG